MGNAVKATVNEIREQLQGLLRERFASDTVHVWVEDFDPDEQWVVFEMSPDDGAMTSHRIGYTADDAGSITLDEGEPTEVRRTVAYAPKSAELTGPIVRKDAAKRIVYGAVLVPGEPDSDGEVLTAEKVEEVAHTWLEQFRAIDNQHSVKQIDAAPVESYIEPAERTVELDGEELTIPAGTWTMAAKIHDDTTWEDIEARKRTGFSIMGVPRASLEEAIGAVKSGDATALKRVTLADVGGGDPNGDWVAPFVSIVDEPAVPKAKFFAMKSVTPAEEGLFRRFTSWLAGEESGVPAAGKAGRKISDKTFGQLKAAQEAISALIVEAEKERTTNNGADKAHEQEEETVDRDEVQKIASEAAEGAVKSALEEQLPELISTAVTEAVNKAAGDDTDGEEPDEVAEKMAELVERLEKVEKRTAAGSRQITDDPDETATKAREPRDLFGRRISA